MPVVDPGAVHEKFGDDYLVNEHTYVMGIDHRLGAAMAERFRGSVVLETCTGAGFMTIALARVAERVVTVEIEPLHQQQAQANVSRAGVDHVVTFVKGDVLNTVLFERSRESTRLSWIRTGPFLGQITFTDS